MNIGFTYDLKDDYLAEGWSSEAAAEFDQPGTIIGISEALEQLGHTVDRIGNVRRLIECLASGKCWDLIFNIAEGCHGFGREAQVPAVLEAYDIPYTFSDPLTLSLALHKGHAKRVIRDIGLPTPDFAVIECEADIANVDLPYPLFAKPLAEGTGKGIDAKSKAKDKAGLLLVCRELLAKHNQPVLVETYLPGREFTVGVVGTGRNARVVGVMEVVFNAEAEAGAYSYINKADYQRRVSYHLVEDAEAKKAAAIALATYQAFNCRDAGRVDLRSDQSGTPNFIEINPLAGLNPIDSDLPILCRLAGIEFQKLISWIVESANERITRRSGDHTGLSGTTP